MHRVHCMVRQRRVMLTIWVVTLRASSSGTAALGDSQCSASATATAEKAKPAIPATIGPAKIAAMVHPAQASIAG
jgi:hypothetical protein